MQLRLDTTSSNETSPSEDEEENLTVSTKRKGTGHQSYRKICI